MRIPSEAIACKTALTPQGGGFIGSFTHSLNPYVGCAFGCPYCYVSQMPLAQRLAAWGTWVKRKVNIAEVLERELKRNPGRDQLRVFMSSATDPYQPEEARTVSRGACWRSSSRS